MYEIIPGFRLPAPGYSFIAIFTYCSMVKPYFTGLLTGGSGTQPAVCQ